MISIVIPTYNERENIILLIKKINESLVNFNNKYEIIIVDDNSPDKTSQEIAKVYKRKPNLRLFTRKNTKGLASAILYGIQKSKGDVIVGMDADFNHPPHAIKKLINELKHHDLVIASRFIKGGGMQDKARGVFTYIFNLFLKYIIGFPIIDNMSGFYVIKKDILFKLPIKQIYSGYGEYHLRLVYLAKKQSLKIKEIPVFYPKRKHGKSKSNLLKMFFRYLFVAFKLKLTDGKI
ncbi:MAG: hypothetical protein US68_C0006G0055 [Candidatus Shapirobacteria bacterium GW2011_GWE1_38_10]|uniref:Glycosyltransferase 2-like domain-containing protein n=1 Tax=Candidatus Shapirobacteria bacterium GW2011_GWE1_38_10 TaxID=1618488 RepID=A0A0G0IH95_9BACT|nr:MAG: hypothetical protein US46_C0002G0124 [Candidatus Shapirobacteria bacterium GW2011_GWF2_37_20]KKQ50375.1 MAG: hypothetical protein US68_C0006G0055 [Candidatus Shapirobacteria bacterium GW2011_GWE1_38_10]KKQ65199.1 MAG: hypothetical protein US85_C0001G0126 [Candidatus Shapirobacteria bacterium GW2011_GWF1_38_23]HBP51307.1 polyprenol monophosphomannose synthase [Candidatus Shapirobacteria bacterium]